MLFSHLLPLPVMSLFTATQVLFVIFIFALSITYSVLNLIAYGQFLIIPFKFLPISLIPFFTFLGVCSSCRYLGHH